MAASSRDLQSEALNLICAANILLQEEEIILSSAEECDYFRNLYRANHRPASRPPQSKPLALPDSPSLEKKKAVEKKAAPVHVPEIEKDLPPLKKEEVLEKRAMPDAGFGDLRKIILKCIPHFPFVADIPDDSRARQVAQRWKMKNQAAAITVFYLQEPPLQLRFLTNFTSALDVIFGSARLIYAEPIEKENQWDLFLSIPDLKLAIMCDCTLQQMPQLLKLYREIPQKNQRFLMEKPLMLLPDPTLYLKDPQLKRTLWESLCRKIESL